MPFWIYGRDGETGEPTDPFFSDAGDESAARREAEAQDLRVESIKRHIEHSLHEGKQQREKESRRTAWERDHVKASKSRRWQVSLRTLLVVVAVLCLGLIWLRPKLERAGATGSLLPVFGGFNLAARHFEQVIEAGLVDT